MENQKIAETKVRSYRKKPVIVQAIQWDGKNLFDVTEFMSGENLGIERRIASDKWNTYKNIVKESGLKIDTLEGIMKVDIGDFIIKGVKGEFYPCKPDIFEQTYIPEEKSVCDPMATQMIEIGKKVKVRNLENSPVMTVIDIMDGKGLIPMKPSAQCVWMKGSSMKSASFSIEALEIAVTQ